MTMKPFLKLLAITLILLGAIGCDSTKFNKDGKNRKAPNSNQKTECLKDETKVPHGWTGKADDDCNTCSCNDGTLSCTEKHCSDDRKHCTKGDARVSHGWTGKADDGCNTCSCIDGSLSCTKKKCDTDEKECSNGDKQIPHGWTGKAEDGCNTCSCDNGSLSCTEMACSSSDTVEDIKKEINTITADLKCTKDSDCQSVGLGARACGGPSSYKIYSTVATNKEKIEALGSRHRELSKTKLSDQESSISICSILEAPVVSCKKELCSI